MKLRTRVLLAGGIVGALLGLGAAYLYLRATPVQVDEVGDERLPAVQPGDAVRVGLSILTAIRAIIGLAQPGT